MLARSFSRRVEKVRSRLERLLASRAEPGGAAEPLADESLREVIRVLERSEEILRARDRGWERTASASAVQEREEVIARIISLIPHHVFWKDRDSVYLGCNDAFAAAAGVDGPDAIVGLTDFDCAWTKEESEFFRKIDRQVMESGEPMIHIEEPIHHADGSEVILLTSKIPLRNAGGEVTGVLGVYTDVTELKRKEEKLRLLATAVDQTAEAIVITDLEGTIEYVNPAFYRITGYTREEAVGQPTRILKSGEHDQEFYRSLWETILSGQVWKGRMTNRRKDGCLYEEEMAISPVLDESGRAVHFVAVKRDVSEVVRLENHLRHSQKMEAIGTLAGGIAHDFNNILYAIRGFAELAAARVGEDERTRLCFEQIGIAVDRGSDLVKRLLAFSRSGEPERRPVSLQKIVNEALSLLMGGLPPTIRVRVRIDEECRPVLADATQIHQIVLCLCANAVHAMRGKEGVLEVRLEETCVGAREAALDPALSEGDYVRLVVSDTGAGIDPAVMDRIFEPFFTTKGVGEGSGMGLPMVHGIVKAHEGAIRVESRPGEGARFDVYFPVCGEPSDPETNATVGTANPGSAARP